MEPVAGSMIAPLIAGMMVYVNYLTSTYGAAANWWAGWAHLACWVAQFVGHGVFEKRAPAILVCSFPPPNLIRVEMVANGGGM